MGLIFPSLPRAGTRVGGGTELRRFSPYTFRSSVRLPYSFRRKIEFYGSRTELRKGPKWTSLVPWDHTGDCLATIGPNLVPKITNLQQIGPTSTENTALPAHLAAHTGQFHPNTNPFCRWGGSGTAGPLIMGWALAPFTYHSP